MKKIILFLFFLLFGFCFKSCKKENKINRNLEGIWKFTEYSTKTGFVNDFSNQTITFKFFKYKNAYTRTMKGIYRVDYLDGISMPIIDTFEYRLANTQLEITKVQNRKVNGALPNTIGFLRRRFLLSNSATSTLTLTRVDTTGFYIKATKQ